MNEERKVDLLRQQIEEANRGDPSDFNRWKAKTEVVLRQTLGSAHHLVEDFQKVRYTPGVYTSGMDTSGYRPAGVRQVIAILEAAIYDVEVSAPAEVAPTAEGLHPWVAGAVVGLWDNGHHKAAVEEAARKVDLMIKAKVGATISGVALMTQAFNMKDPSADHRRLRFTEFDQGTDDWTSAHEGAFNFARGCMQRIRNLTTHRDDELPEQVALEYLAALSILARWSDEAVVVAAP